MTDLAGPLDVRAERLDALYERLTSSVGDLVSGEDWKRALTFAARFRSRSFSNTVLIYVQHRAAFEEGRVLSPAPTYVAGYRQWLGTGRHVVKGQAGYAIFAPVTTRVACSEAGGPESWRRLSHGEAPRAGEVVRSRMVGVRVAHVWDVSQTEGEPVPEVPRPVLLRGQAPAGLWDGLADQVTGRGFELRLVSSAAVIGGANGQTDFLTREVAVRTDMEDAAQVKTLAHELGHVALHGIKPGADTSLAADAAMHRGVAEVEAESVALMVAAAHGLDTTSYSVPYVATWASTVQGRTPLKVVQSTADRVRSTAVAVLDQLDTPQLSDGRPPTPQARRIPLGLDAASPTPATRREPDVPVVEL